MGLADVSVVIPTYNEASTIGRLIESLIEMGVGEIIVVDDGSTDGTREIVEKLAKRHAGKVKLLKRPRKMGLGSAYKDGFRLCKGSVVVEMDADLSHRPEDLPRIVDAIGRADVVIGSRYVRGGRTVGWPLRRRVVSRGANLMARLLLGLDVRDATSGFRAYRREVFGLIARKSILNDFNFQVEAIYIAKKHGYRVMEVPITFVERAAGRSKMGLREMASFLIGLLKIRLRRKVS